MASELNHKVSYFYDPQTGNFHYGQGHPMKPHRIQITNSLVFDYGLHKKMQVYNAPKSSDFELMRYHSREYVEFLKKITPYWDGFLNLLKKRINANCP